MLLVFANTMVTYDADCLLLLEDTTTNTTTVDYYDYSDQFTCDVADDCDYDDDGSFSSWVAERCCECCYSVFIDSPWLSLRWAVSRASWRSLLVPCDASSLPCNLRVIHAFVLLLFILYALSWALEGSHWWLPRWVVARNNNGVVVTVTVVDVTLFGLAGWYSACSSSFCLLFFCIIHNKTYEGQIWISLFLCLFLFLFLPLTSLLISSSVRWSNPIWCLLCFSSALNDDIISDIGLQTNRHTQIID